MRTASALRDADKWRAHVVTVTAQDVQRAFQSGCVELVGKVCLPAVAGPAAAAAIAATTIAAAVAGTVLTRSGFIDRQFPTPHLSAVEGTDGRIRLIVGLHLHEAEAFGLAGVTVRNDGNRCDRAEGSKQIL